MDWWWNGVKETDSKWMDWLREDYYKSEPPLDSKEDSWVKINAELSEQEKQEKRWTPKKSLLAVACMILVTTGTVFWTSDKMQAFGWFVHIFETSEGDTTQISQTKIDEKELSSKSLPDNEEFTFEEVKESSKEMSLKEAQKETEFYIAQPDFLPERYQLDMVTVFFENSTSNKVVSIFRSGENEISLEQTYQSSEAASVKVIDNEDSDLKTVYLANSEARLMHFKDGTNQLVWSTADNNWILKGEVTGTTLMNIAKSIK